MPIGPAGLKAFKAAGSPPMPQPPVTGAAKPAIAPPAAPAAPPHPGAAPPAAAGAGDAAAVKKAAAEVAAGQVDPDVQDMLAAGADATAPPTAAADAELWQHCVELVDPEGAGATKFQNADPWMVVGQLYSNLGGEIDMNEGGEEGGEGHPEPDGDEESPTTA